MPSLLAREISFTLDDGYTAVIRQEERRVYDVTIQSNVGVVTTIALEDEHWLSWGLLPRNHRWLGIDKQVRNILDKSHLSEPDLERIWQITTTIGVEGLPNGAWTQLKVYVALHFVQKFGNLSLDQMTAHEDDAATETHLGY